MLFLLEEFIELMKLCLIHNFCKFGGKIYTFDKDVPMGSPLAPLMAEVFMDLFEGKILSPTSNFNQYITYWHRYVDDVLCLWKGTRLDLDNFLSFINSVYPSIKFTMEVGGYKINFLDLKIFLNNGRHQFGIYRKPTCKDITIHSSSFCPPSHKHAAYHSLIHRLVSIPLSSSAFHEEVNTIKFLAKRNDVKLNI